MAAKRQSLGKGLDALLGIPEGSDNLQEVLTDYEPIVESDTLRQIPIAQLQRGQCQPRRTIDSQSLEELAESIASQGIIQPVVVRALGQSNYEIIAGERRWRAAQKVGLDSIPAVIREVSDEAAVAMALIENIHREDLNPIEESLALIRLQNEFKLTQKKVAEVIGKSRTAVANLMRLATLEPLVRQQVERGDLDLGHAKCLLGLQGTEQVRAARMVVAKDMTVRETEALVKKFQTPATDEEISEAPQDLALKCLQEELSKKLGSPISIRHHNNGSGRLIVKYNSVNELDDILTHLR
jgi:ParB family chromosome partitioning protein